MLLPYLSIIINKTTSLHLEIYHEQHLLDRTKFTESDLFVNLTQNLVFSVPFRLQSVHCCWQNTLSPTMFRDSNLFIAAGRILSLHHCLQTPICSLLLAESSLATTVDRPGAETCCRRVTPETFQVATSTDRWDILSLVLVFYLQDCHAMQFSSLCSYFLCLFHLVHLWNIHSECPKWQQEPKHLWTCPNTEQNITVNPTPSPVRR